ncbi:MAG: hypothetical protein AAFV85_19215 [Cyanobacteria bacterium J06634_6]
MLSIDLDEEAKQYVDKILEKKKVDVSELVKQLLKEHADSLPEKAKTEEQVDILPNGKTVIERMGGMPDYFASIGGLSSREARKAAIAEHIQARHSARHESS